MEISIGLYRGYLWSTMGSFPGIITHVSVYTMAKYQLSYNELNTSHNLFSHSMDYSETSETKQLQQKANQTSIPQFLIPLISGLIAESVAVVAYVPQEVVSQRFVFFVLNVYTFSVYSHVHLDQIAVVTEEYEIIRCHQMHLQ